MSKSFSAAFIVPEKHPSYAQVKQFESRKAAVDLGRSIGEKFRPHKITSIVEGHDAYALTVVVLTPDEYDDLKETEAKYKDLQK